MEKFNEAFVGGVFDNNHLVGANCDEGGCEEEIWNPRKIMEEPIIEKTWATCWTVCQTNGLYTVNIRGLYERMNPLRYNVRFDGCTLHLFEEGGGLNILVENSLTKSNLMIYKLQELQIQIGNYAGERYSGDCREVYKVQHVQVEIPMDSGTELNFSIELRYSMN